MKKLFTLLAAIATVFCMNAATAVWSASDLTDCENNAALDGVSAQINSNLSIAFANGEATENNYIRYRSVTALPEPVVAFYSKNVITLSAKEAVITSIEFNINTEEGGNDATPGWKFTANGTTLSAETNTWTGSAEEVVLIGGSKTSIISLKIEYTPSTPAEPGTELSNTWMATQLTDVANNDVLDGMTFDINDALSFSLANNGSDKDIIFKKTSSAPTTINIYSKGQITFKAAEGATIKSIKFIVNTSEGTSNTPGWNLQDNGTSYTADNDTWTGNATEITFTDKSAVQLMGFEITYETAGGNQGGDEGDDDDDDNAGEYESAALFFSGDLIGQGEIAQDVTLSDNGTSVHFTSNSANAQIDDITFNYGTAEEYTPIRYRYRPGGKSSNGVNSTNKGVFTFPCKGTLYLYAFNNQNDERSLQIIQNDETIFDHTYLSTDCEIIPGDGADVPDTKIYPVLNVEVSKGTATLLWPVNQVMISGFEFVPAESEGDNEGDNSAVEGIVTDYDKNAPAYDLFGNKVDENYRGIFIQNGKKYIRH